MGTLPGVVKWSVGMGVSGPPGFAAVPIPGPSGPGSGDCCHGTTEQSIRDLRNHGGDVVDRVERGESFVVTRSGKPVAELRPPGSRGLPVAELIRRRAHLPMVDPDALQRDVDTATDAAL
jgi:prevent-host-death family protein